MQRYDDGDEQIYHVYESIQGQFLWIEQWRRKKSADANILYSIKYQKIDSNATF